MPQHPKTLDQAYQEVLDELMRMFLKKHKDYGKGNILSVKELGIALRVTEKVERIKNLVMKESLDGGKNSPVNESIDETWTDIAVYAIIAKLFRKGLFQKLEVDPKKLEKI
ncbi:MAG TPA: hypothetical protein VFG51_03900 [Candidatus Saccharimonadia bacterium]|nr:hypothetical protein [Candidatus Saccharimonadia bacterium]